MIERKLDSVARKQPNTLQSVDYVVPPAGKPWPTYDDEPDPVKVFEDAVRLGLATKALAYERENRQRQDVMAALEAQLVQSPEPEEREPVLASPTRRAEEPLVPVDGIPRIATI
jgi:hypothetical protein